MFSVSHVNYAPLCLIFKSHLIVYPPLIRHAHFEITQLGLLLDKMNCTLTMMPNTRLDFGPQTGEQDDWKMITDNLCKCLQGSNVMNKDLQMHCIPLIPTQKQTLPQWRR